MTLKLCNNRKIVKIDEIYNDDLIYQVFFKEKQSNY